MDAKFIAKVEELTGCEFESIPTTPISEIFSYPGAVMARGRGAVLCEGDQTYVVERSPTGDPLDYEIVVWEDESADESADEGAEITIDVEPVEE